MNRLEFETEVSSEGYKISEGEIKPNTHRESHVHGWDARLFVLEGHLTLVRASGTETFGPGDACSVLANTPHEEHTEADGVRYLAARRTAQVSAAA